MARTVTKVIYKPDSQSTEEFTVIVDPGEFKKWKEGDTTIPLAQVVDSFAIYSSTQGAQGLLGRPSKQQLENVFGSHNDADVILKILTNGREQKASEVASNAPGGTYNASRGGSDNRSSVGTSF